MRTLVIDHPLVAHKLGKLRKTDTVVKDSSATGKVVDAPKKASTPEVPSSASPTSAGPTTI